MLRRSTEDTSVPAPADWTANTSRINVLDPREIARILRRHIKLVLVVPVVMLLLAAAFVATATPTYTATVNIFIDPRRSNVAEPTTPVLSNFGTDDSSIESQVLLIQSRAVLRRVVDQLGLADDPEFSPPPGILDRIKGLFSKGRTGADPGEAAKARAVEALKRRIKVVRQRATFIADVSATSLVPAKAATIANAVAEAYFMEQVRSKHDATKIAGGWLNTQIEGLKSRVIASERAVQDFRSANNLIAAQGVTVNDQQITDLNNKLIEARVQTAEARAKFEQVRELASNGNDPGAVAEALSSDIIARIRTQYAELAKSDAELSTKYGSRHPMVESMRAQLRNTQRLINDEVQRILQSRKHTYEVARAREDSLEQSLDRLQNVSTESGQAQVTLRELQREADANRTLYESYMARYRETSAQETLEMPESRVIARAEVPLAPSFPRIPLTLGLSVIMGLGLGALLALIADYLDRRVKSPDQARTATGLPGIASLPAIGVRELAMLARRGRSELAGYDPSSARLLPAGLQPPLMRYAVDQPTSAFAEAVRAIRLEIQRTTRVRPLQVVMVTSAVDSEGKTTLAANLALSFAMTGVRTVLVDGDLRNPEITRSLCPRVPAGLVETTIGDVPLQKAILVEPSTRLAILPAPQPRNPAIITEFVPSDSMASILGQLRHHFEMIVIDAPPLIPLIDSRALAEHADGILLAVGWDRTPQDVLTRAVEILSPTLDRIIGTVLTRVDLNRLRFYDSSDTAIYTVSYPYGERRVQEAAR